MISERRRREEQQGLLEAKIKRENERKTSEQKIKIKEIRREDKPLLILEKTMALKNCPSCNNPLSPQAEKCPHCGHPMKIKPSSKPLGIFLICVSALCVWGGLSNSDKTDYEKSQEEYIYAIKKLDPTSDRLEEAKKSLEKEQEERKQKKVYWFSSAGALFIVALLITRM